MEKLFIDKNITVFYKTATSFPDGVLQAHQSLHQLVPFSTERRYFGISRPENGIIVYKAAAEELEPGEGARLGCGTMVLEKGNYIAVRAPGFMKDPSILGRIFQELIRQPGLDPQGYCVEEYLNDKDAICMIRLAS